MTVLIPHVCIWWQRSKKNTNADVKCEQGFRHGRSHLGASDSSRSSCVPAICECKKIKQIHLHKVGFECLPHLMVSPLLNLHSSVPNTSQSFGGKIQMQPINCSNEPSTNTSLRLSTHHRGSYHTRNKPLTCAVTAIDLIGWLAFDQLNGVVNGTAGLWIE